MGSNSFPFGVMKTFWNWIEVVTVNVLKATELLSLKWLTLSKGNHKQDEKTTLRMGENICKRINGQRINLQNI